MRDTRLQCQELEHGAMSNPFFDHPILNSPYEIPARHWELDKQGQPTQKIVEIRRPADFITPIPKAPGRN
jgi:type III restriction enzyme